MKKAFISVILLATSSNVYASDSLKSIFYKPGAKDLASETSYSFTSEEYFSDSGILNRPVKVETDTVTEKLSYGVCQKLHFDLEISHQNLEEELTTPNNGRTFVTDARGFTNPELVLNYRAANQKEDGFYADLKLSFAPDFFKSSISSSVNKNGLITA